MKVMKKIFYFILAGLLLAGCATKEATTVDPASLVDLRYRIGKDAAGAEDSRYTPESSTYAIESTKPAPIALVVKSSKPWSIRSTHPTWCTIDVENGQAVADSLVHLGKGENAKISIQYYDNVKLDDRLDTLILFSDYWVGKKIIVNQKGTAYLDVDDKSVEMAKDGSDVSFNILSNQDWSVEVVQGKGDDWLSITSGASGNGNGTVTLHGLDNGGEVREGFVRVFDRNGAKQRWQVMVTQAGIQLVPAGAIDMGDNEYEVRGYYDQQDIVFAVESNAEWTATKKKDSDTWFSFADADPSYDGNHNLGIKLTQYNGTDADGIREAIIVLKTKPTAAGVYVSKEVKIRQAYKPQPTTYTMNSDEMKEGWEQDTSYPGTVVYKEDLGGLEFASKARIRARSARRGVVGTYNLYWSHISADVNVRAWFCYSGSDEIKLNFDYAGSKAKVELNNGSAGPAPSLSSLAINPAQTSRVMSFTCLPIEDDYVQVIFKADNDVVTTFNTSKTVLEVCKWGTALYNLYIGTTTTAGSAVLEKIEFIPAFTAW